MLLFYIILHLCKIFTERPVLVSFNRLTDFLKKLHLDKIMSKLKCKKKIIMTYFIRYSNNTTFIAHVVKTKITAATILNDTIFYVTCYKKEGKNV